MRYRPHRGGLAEAMAEAVEISDLDGLVAHMRSTWGLGHADAATMVVEPYGGDDERIGWKDVHLIKWEHALGYTEGDPRVSPRRA